MTDQIQWAEPPPKVRGNPTSKHTALADALRANPGQWAILGNTRTATTASQINAGLIVAFAAGFEATSRKRPDKAYDTYVRFIGEAGEHA